MMGVHLLDWIGVEGSSDGDLSRDSPDTMGSRGALRGALPKFRAGGYRYRSSLLLLGGFSPRTEQHRL